MKSPWPTKKLGDCVKEGLIELKRGDVISEKDMRECPGPYPVYSSSSQNNGLFGTYGKYMFDEELIT
jgi:type I restriction enzyme S subunit